MAVLSHLSKDSECSPTLQPQPRHPTSSSATITSEDLQTNTQVVHRYCLRYIHSMPRGIPKAKQDESAMKFTSFHVPLPSVLYSIVLP